MNSAAETEKLRQAKDWTEDFIYHDGAHQRECPECKAVYFGGSHRELCKECFDKTGLLLWNIHFRAIIGIDFWKDTYYKEHHGLYGYQYTLILPFCSLTFSNIEIP